MAQLCRPENLPACVQNGLYGGCGGDVYGICGPIEGDHYFGEVCCYRRPAPAGRSRHFRRQERSRGHPARHHPGFRRLCDRESANISDVSVSLHILSALGAQVRMLNRNTYEIDTTHLVSTNVPDDPVPADAGQLLLPGRAAVPVRQGPGGPCPAAATWAPGPSTST